MWSKTKQASVGMLQNKQTDRTHWQEAKVAVRMLGKIATRAKVKRHRHDWHADWANLKPHKAVPRVNWVDRALSGTDLQLRAQFYEANCTKQSFIGLVKATVSKVNEETGKWLHRQWQQQQPKQTNKRLWEGKRFYFGNITEPTKWQAVIITGPDNGEGRLAC